MDTTSQQSLVLRLNPGQPTINPLVRRCFGGSLLLPTLWLVVLFLALVTEFAIAVEEPIATEVFASTQDEEGSSSLGRFARIVLEGGSGTIFADSDQLRFSVISGPLRGILREQGGDVIESYPAVTAQNLLYLPDEDFFGVDTITYQVDNGVSLSNVGLATISAFSDYLDTARQLGASIVGANSGDMAGNTIALSSDGHKVAVASSRNGDNGENSGQVRVFQFSGAGWNQLGGDINGEASDDFSGGSLSLSSDGQTVAIGAAGNDGNGASSGHVRIYRFSGGDWAQLGDDIDGANAGDTAATVSLSGDGRKLAVGARFHDGVGGPDSGHIRVYIWSGTNWQQLGSVIEGDNQGDNFGEAVAISGDGRTIVVGSSRSDAGGSNAGMVSVWRISDSDWTQVNVFDLEGEAAGDFFGRSVAISDDGQAIAVGAPNNSDSQAFSGHVRVFRQLSSSVPTIWVQQGLDIDGSNANDFSGGSVSLSADGRTLAIGARFNAENGEGAGQTRVYRYKSVTGWQPLVPAIFGEDVGDLSGSAVALSADGTTLAVGSPGHGASGEGHVRIFGLTETAYAPSAANISIAVQKNESKAGMFLIGRDSNEESLNYRIITEPEHGTYNREANSSRGLYEPDPDFTGQDSFTYVVNDGERDSNIGTVSITVFPNFLTAFQLGDSIDGANALDSAGISVALSDDGGTLAIGSSTNSDNGNQSGHVRVFRLIDGSWAQLGSSIPGEQAGDASGSSVAVSSDGLTVAIGSPQNNGNGDLAGQVRVFGFEGSDWKQLGRGIDGEAAGDRFGETVALSSDGNVFASGAPFNDGGGAFSGHVRVYRFEGATWVQVGLDIDGEQASNLFGQSLSLSRTGSTFASGAPQAGNDESKAGRTKVFQRRDGAWMQREPSIDGQDGDSSGSAVSLSADGSRVAIGAPENSDNGFLSGSVRVYRTGSFAGAQLGNDIKGNEADLFGSAVSLSGDGKLVAIGARQSDTSNLQPGVVRVYFEKQQKWQQLGFDITGSVPGDSFGRSVSISRDGRVVAIGAPRNGSNGASSGQVKIYRLVTIDTDNDDIDDGVDNCPFISNFEQLDTDFDTLGNACDDDDDNDGLSDEREAELGTNPLGTDTDLDGLRDNVELEVGTNPVVSDTDGDGFADGDEIDADTDPLDASSQPEPVAGLPIWLLYKSLQ
ncbi:MAG: Ig-like domain-containing protein [Pseudomonadota bacterium]